MGKADIRLQFVSNALVLDKLFAAMRRDRMGFLRQRIQELDDNIGHVLDLLQARQAGLRIRQGDNGMMTSFADDRRSVNVNKSSDYCLIISGFHKCIPKSIQRINPVSLPKVGELRVGSHTVPVLFRYQRSFDMAGLRSTDATAAYLLFQHFKVAHVR
jgi:hypothetical protein